MKIPTPIKRGNAYRIEKMLGGKKISATFDTAKECEQWCAKKILEYKVNSNAIESGQKPKHSLNELFDVYLLKVSKYKKGVKRENDIIRIFREKYPNFANMDIANFTPQVITQWRNQRLKQVQSGTVLREIGLLSSIFTYGSKELFWIDSNPFLQVKKPQAQKERDRRITNEEINLICEQLHYKRGQVPSEPRHYIAWCFLFALDTAMRRGEILGLTADCIYPDFVRLKDTKNGTARDVPLLNSAKDLLALLPKDVPKLIPHTENSFKLCFKRALAKTGIKDLRFHDTRHEAITRLALLLPVQDLAKLTGHKTISILINTYYNPTASEISKRLNSSNY